MRARLRLKSLEVCKSESQVIVKRTEELKGEGAKFISDKECLEEQYKLINEGLLAKEDRGDILYEIENAIDVLKADFMRSVERENQQIEIERQTIIEDVRTVKEECCKKKVQLDKDKFLTSVNVNLAIFELRKKEDEARKLENRLLQEQEENLLQRKKQQSRMGIEVNSTDWARTASTSAEERILHDMEEKGEIEEYRERTEFEEPSPPILQLPTEETGLFLGERGNSPFVPNSAEALEKMKEYGKNWVEYKNGYPDFSPFVEIDLGFGKIQAQVEISHMTHSRNNPEWEYGRRPKGCSHDPEYEIGNYAQADNELALKIGKSEITGTDIELFRKKKGLTWHECQDRRTMQLIPKEIHGACKHSGGVAWSKYGMLFGDTWVYEN